MVLGKLLVTERHTNLDDSRAWAYCACSRCRWDCLDIFLSSIISLLSPPLLKVARYRLKYCLKGPLNKKKKNQKYDMVQENKENLMLICDILSYFCGRYWNRLIEEQN